MVIDYDWAAVVPSIESQAHHDAGQTFGMETAEPVRQSDWVGANLPSE